MLLLHRISRGRLVLQTALLLALLVGGALSAAEKVLVVSLKPADELFQDISYLAKATGTAPFAGPMLQQVKEYFKGIDGKKPIGVVVTMDGEGFVPLGFLPVTDLQTVLAQFKGQLGEPTDAGNGVLELQGPQPIFVKEVKGWAFLGQTVESLANLPDNPESLLEGLSQTYDLAARLYVKNVPDPYKQMFIGQLRDNLDSSPGTSEEDKEAALKQLNKFVEESDVVTLGWQIAPTQREINFDMQLDAVPGSKLAQQFDAVRGVKSQFTSFLVEGAAISGNLATVMLPEEIVQAMKQMDGFEKSTLEQVDQDEDLDEKTRASAKQLVATFFQIARSTIKTGKLDSCTSVLLQPNSLTVLSASHVASGTEVETAVKQLVTMSQNDSEVALSNVKLNAETHAGVRLHTMELPIPEQDYARKALGDTLKIVVGAGEQSAYIALGADGLTQLKKLIDGSSKAGQQTVEPLDAQISLLPVMEYVKSIESNPIVESLTAMLANQKGQDQFKVRTSMTDKGVMYRVSLEEGVLSVLGQGVQFIGMQQAF